MYICIYIDMCMHKQTYIISSYVRTRDPARMSTPQCTNVCTQLVSRRFANASSPAIQLKHVDAYLTKRQGGGRRGRDNRMYIGCDQLSRDAKFMDLSNSCRHNTLILILVKDQAHTQRHTRVSSPHYSALIYFARMTCL